MPRLRLGANVQRYSGGMAELLVEGRTVRQVLESAFARLPGLRSYVLDDQGSLRKHMTIFVDEDHVLDRSSLSEIVGEASTVDIYQALSGG